MDDTFEDRPASRLDPAPWWRTALRWFGAGVLTGPFAVLPHEIAHYAVLLAIGAPGLVFGPLAIGWSNQAFYAAFGAGDYAAAAAVAPIWGVAFADIAGPLMTYAIVAACCYGCSRWGGLALFVAVAYAAQFRITTGTGHVFRALLGTPIPPTANFDELRFAALTGIPVTVPVLLNVAVLVVSGLWLLRYFPSGRRRVAMPAVAAGIGVGLFLYALLSALWMSV